MSLPCPHLDPAFGPIPRRRFRTPGHARRVADTTVAANPNPGGYCSAHDTTDRPHPARHRRRRGFIGSPAGIAGPRARVVNLDKADLRGQSGKSGRPALIRSIFVRGDIGNAELVDYHAARLCPRRRAQLCGGKSCGPFHRGPGSLYAPMCWARPLCCGWSRTGGAGWTHPAAGRFLHVSTDEVFGALRPDPPFTESTPYSPNSPFALQGRQRPPGTGLSRNLRPAVLLTNCSTTTGRAGFPEKLIPLWSSTAWLAAPCRVRPKEAMSATGCMWKTTARPSSACWRPPGPAQATISAAGPSAATWSGAGRLLCWTSWPRRQRPAELIRFVTDRPGRDFPLCHELRQTGRDLGWKPQHDFTSGLRATVR